MKKIHLISATIVLLLAAFAPIPTAKDEIELKLTVTEVNVILNSLQTAPFKDAAPLINKIIAQGSPQMKQDTIPQPPKKK